MKPELVIIGLNHESAPLPIRERVAFAETRLGEFNKVLKNALGLDECLVLSTCNRTEIYAYASGPSEIIHWIAAHGSIEPKKLAPHLYVHEGAEVLRHLTRVASGMNSMVLGETQILGQIKTAFREAEISRSVGRILRKLFYTAFSLAKDVRSSTDIGAHSISLAAASLRVAERIFVDFSQQSVLFIGAGDMVTLFGEHYSKRKFGRICFANRTKKRAMSLAERFGGESCDLSSAINSEKLSQFDIIVSCTASPIPILGKGVLEASAHLRKHKPLVLIDLAVPRDIETSAATLDDVFLFSIDDLGDVVRQGFSKRQVAAEDANKIIDRMVDDFSDWMESDGSVIILKKFRSHGASLVEIELEKAISAINRNEDPEKVLRSFSTSLEKKFLDRPSRALNKARGSQRDELSFALVKLFNLDDQI